MLTKFVTALSVLGVVIDAQSWQPASSPKDETTSSNAMMGGMSNAMQDLFDQTAAEMNQTSPLLAFDVQIDCFNNNCTASFPNKAYYFSFIEEVDCEEVDQWGSVDKWQSMKWYSSYWNDTSNEYDQEEWQMWYNQCDIGGDMWFSIKRNGVWIDEDLNDPTSIEIREMWATFNSTGQNTTKYWTNGVEDTWSARDEGYDFWAEHRCETVCDLSNCTSTSDFDCTNNCTQVCDMFEIHFDPNPDCGRWNGDKTTQQIDCSEWNETSGNWTDCYIDMRWDQCNLTDYTCNVRSNEKSWESEWRCDNVHHVWAMLTNSTSAGNSTRFWRDQSWNESYFQNEWYEGQYSEEDWGSDWWNMDDDSDDWEMNECWTDCYDNTCTMTCDWGSVSYLEEPECWNGYIYNNLVVNCSAFPAINSTDCEIYYSYDQCDLTAFTCYISGRDASGNQVFEDCQDNYSYEMTQLGSQWDFMNPNAENDNGWEDWWSNEDDYVNEHVYEEGANICEDWNLDCEYVDCDADQLIEDLGCWKEVCLCSGDGDDTCDLWHYHYDTEEWMEEPCYSNDYDMYVDGDMYDDEDMYDDVSFDGLEKASQFVGGFNDTFQYLVEEAEFEEWCEDFSCVTNATANFIDNNDLTAKLNQALANDDMELAQVVMGDAEDTFDIDVTYLNATLSLENASQVQQVVDHALENIQDETDGLVAGFISAFREGFENLGSTRKGSRWG